MKDYINELPSSVKSLTLQEYQSLNNESSCPVSSALTYNDVKPVPSYNNSIRSSSSSGRGSLGQTAKEQAGAEAEARAELGDHHDQCSSGSATPRNTNSVKSRQSVRDEYEALPPPENSQKTNSKTSSPGTGKFSSYRPRILSKDSYNLSLKKQHLENLGYKRSVSYTKSANLDTRHLLTTQREHRESLMGLRPAQKKEGTDIANRESTSLNGSDSSPPVPFDRLTTAMASTRSSSVISPRHTSFVSGERVGISSENRKSLSAKISGSLGFARCHKIDFSEVAKPVCGADIQDIFRPNLCDKQMKRDIKEVTRRVLNQINFYITVIDFVISAYPITLCPFRFLAKQVAAQLRAKVPEAQADLRQPARLTHH